MTRYALFNLAALGALIITPLALAKKAPKHQVEALRAQGAAGLQIALESDDDRLVDAVAGQRYARYSELYWHTDLDAAIQTATALNKPIVSLTLLGDLRDEYTCANSRFFRAFLYSHPDVAKMLRDEFVLHWASERDVPRVTVEFSDGRALTRTITGNSVHYLLDADGTPIDALPGVFSPEAFLAELHGWKTLHAQVESAGDARALAVTRHHERALGGRSRRLVSALAEVRATDAQLLSVDDQDVWNQQATQWMSTGSYNLASSIPAFLPMELAVSKLWVERPILRAIDPRQPTTTGESGATLSPQDWRPPQGAEWQALGLLNPVSFHEQSVALMRSENPVGPAGGSETRMLERLRESVAADTARNQYMLRPKIQSWFASGEVTDLRALNRRVYDEVFATPATDPWLGMLDVDAYSGLINGGVSVPTPAKGT
ncbi:MAG: hypothetical protein AB8H79_13165 [Myxococcota bacterium]